MKNATTDERGFKDEDVARASDYVIVRIRRDGALAGEPEGSLNYTGWLRLSQHEQLRDMARDWGRINEREGRR